MSAQGEGISWVVHTHEHKDRSVDWYWTLGLAAVAAAGASIFFGNFLFAAIIGIAAGSMGVLVARGPRTHWVRVDTKGVSMDGTLYPYRSIHSFWVEPFNAAAGQHGRLLISNAGLLHPQLVIPLEESARAASVRTYLKKYIPEEEQHAHIGEHLAEIFGL